MVIQKELRERLLLYMTPQAERKAAEGGAKKHAERAVPAGTSFLLGRAKSCQWQVFVRRRPPKQGELRTDVSKATMFQGDDSVLRPRFKALSEKILAEFSGNTSRTRLFAQNGGEKALNRCEVPVLQRKELERRLKEQPCSLVDSRLWLGGNGRWRAEKSCFEW